MTNSRLVVLTGPEEGRTLSLGRGSHRIGRHASNDLVLREVAVSRHHAAIDAENGSALLRDLGSRHGVAVNTRPVEETPLAHGDLITIGSSTLLYQAHDASPLSEDGPLRFDDSAFLTDSTVALEISQALYSHPQGVLELAATGDRDRALGVLLRAGAKLGACRSYEELADRLLELTLEAVPARRAAFLLAAAGEERFEPVFVRRADGGRDADVSISRTATLRVMHQKVALLSNDVRTAEELQGAESLESSRVGALLSVPLLSVPSGKVLGVLYQDAGPGGGGERRRFTEGDLKILTALAGMAAPVAAHLQHLEWVEGDRRRLLSETLDHDLVGESPPMARVVDLIARVAPTDSTVLIRGESGTGKELVAQALHRGSPRRDRPFLAINCATLSDTLLESELFGHERGAFTGAVAKKLGKLEVAAGGTVFLDEVAELPPALQAKLLRVLQERVIERVGGIRPIPINVRVIAATHRDLEEAIREGAFREDLFYRLHVIALPMPPLRDRRSDVPLLVAHFLRLLSARLGRPCPEVPPRMKALLQAYDWPGNVRELANALERALVLCPGEVLRPEDLPEALLESAGDDGPLPDTYHGALRETKKRLILAAVEKAGGNITEAAKALDLHPNYLHRLIKNLDLRSRLP